MNVNFIEIYTFRLCQMRVAYMNSVMDIMRRYKSMGQNLVHK